MKSIKSIIALGFGACLMACSPSTRITGSWTAPSAAGKVNSGKTIFVASMTRNIEARTKIESAFAAEAGARNIKAVKSSDYFSPDFYQKLPSEQQMMGKIKGSGANLILTASLINRESETRYVPGAGGYMPFSNFGWYGGFYSYYSFWGPRFYDPGYYVTDKTYFLETNIYDLATRKLIWSAQSETVNPGSLDNFAKTYPKVLIAQLIKDGVLR